MGYNSDVHCVIYGLPERIDALIAEVKLSGSIQPNPFDAFTENITTTRRKVEYSNLFEKGATITVMHMHGAGWKWYPNYPDVVAWGALLALIDEKLDEGVTGLAYEFVRVGEDEGDIERQSSNNTEHWLYTTTQIVDSSDDYTTTLEDQNE